MPRERGGGRGRGERREGGRHTHPLSPFSLPFSSLRTWIAFAQINTHALYLPSCKQLNQNKFSVSTKDHYFERLYLKRRKKIFSDIF